MMIKDLIRYEFPEDESEKIVIPMVDPVEGGIPGIPRHADADDAEGGDGGGEGGDGDGGDKKE